MKNFYKVLFTLFLFGSSYSILNAQLIFSESFNYSVGTSLSANGWTAVAGNQTATHSIQNDPTFGLGNSLTLSTTTTTSPLPTLRFDKPLGGTYAGDTDANGDVYWLGFWIRTNGDATTYAVAAQVNLMNGSNTTTDQRIGLGKTSNFTTGANSANSITAFTRASSGGCAAQNWPSAFNVVAPATVPITSVGTNYVLMKITKGEFSLNVGSVSVPVFETFDGIRVWVLSAPPASEAALSPLGDYTTQDATMTTIPGQTRLLRSTGNTGNTTCRKSGVDGIRIRFEGSSTNGLTAAIDEIRFAKGSLNFILPIELADITAYKKGASNIVKWTTASETNNKGFHIERSSDASTWETIGFVKGAGDSQQKLTYSFTDNAPLSISYYRLRQEDNDGRTTNSKAVSVLQNGKLNVKITPNPVKDNVNISLDKESEKNFVTVYDVVGRSVMTTQFSGNQSELNVSNLIKGIYFINVQAEGKTITQKFFKE
jgi:Secretion system C-terminal sorting domain